MSSKRVELAALWLAIFAQTVSFSVYSPLVPQIRSELNLSYTDFGLLATAFYVPYTALQVVVGHSAGRGRTRSLMLPGMAVVFASTVLLGFVTNLPEAIVLRFVAGAAGATIFVPSVMVISRSYPERTYRALGAYGTGVAAAPLYVSLLAPVLGLWFGWRLAIVLMMLPAVVVWAAIYVGVSDFAAPRTDSRSSIPRLWRDVLRNRVTWLLGYQQLARVGMWATILTFLPTFFASGLGYSTFVASSALTIFAVLAAASSVLGARMVDLLNSNAKVSFVSLSILGTVLVLIGLFNGGAAPWALTIVMGLVVTMAFGAQFTIATQLYPRDSVGLAVGVQAVLGNIGAILIPYGFGNLLDRTGSFRASWVACGVVCLTASVVGVVLVRMERRRKERTAAGGGGQSEDGPGQS